MYKYILKCRACDNAYANLTPVCNFGIQALANDFRRLEEDHAGHAPLKVLFCPQCTLAQLSVVVDPQELYRTYFYETSKSQTMRDHFSALWNEIRAEGSVENVIEIGSNDGAFLQFAKANGSESVVGIDAAENLAVVANQNGIRTVVGILDNHTSDCASRIVPNPDVIIARHVFCHADDWHKFMRNVDSMCQRDTLIVIEVPYVMDTLDRAEFDQIYHEHLSYLSLRAISALLDSTPLRLQRAIRFPIHGGSIVLFIRRRDWKGEADGSVADLIAKEQITPDIWANFSAKARNSIEALKSLVRVNRRDGKKVVGYGAPAKSTLWISACEFTKSDISYICDSTPWKQGKLSPGSDIPIVPESQFTNEAADIAVLWSWNYEKEIKNKNAAWIAGGGRFINPHGS